MDNYPANFVRYSIKQKQTCKPRKKKLAKIPRFQKKLIIFSYKKTNETKMEMLFLAIKWIYKLKYDQKV